MPVFHRSLKYYFKQFLTPLIHRPYSTPGININIVLAGMAKCLGVCMAATITPQVKFPAIPAQRNVATVAIDNSVIFAADLAEHLLFNGDHFERLL